MRNVGLLILETHIVVQALLVISSDCYAESRTASA